MERGCGVGVNFNVLWTKKCCLRNLHSYRRTQFFSEIRSQSTKDPRSGWKVENLQSVGHIRLRTYRQVTVWLWTSRRRLGPKWSRPSEHGSPSGTDDTQMPNETKSSRACISCTTSESGCNDSSSVELKQNRCKS